MRNIITFLSCVLMLAFVGSCQKVQAQTISRSREYGFNIGMSSFLGDLGGTDDIGRPFFWDVDPEVTRPALGFVFRQEVRPHVAMRFNAFWSELRGADSLSDNVFRNYRNLSFKSPIVEVSAMGELSFTRYVGPFKKRFNPYVYGGIGLFYFNPQANLNGQWIELQPLGTEGQGLEQYPYLEKYSRVALCFPLGGGFRYLLTNNWVVGFEMAVRYTNTDYIDDVSGYYANPDYYYLNYDPATAALATELSDRSDGTRLDLINPGSPLDDGRGDPTDFDTYIFGGIFTLTYQIEVRKKPKFGKCYFKWDKAE
ncbi:MAG: hypothetical protein H7X71_02395 [Chitinophagales bacterium]|nr:hypothetical protein [Chitinophagales bacterium]